MNNNNTLFSSGRMSSLVVCCVEAGVCVGLLNHCVNCNQKMLLFIKVFRGSLLMNEYYRKLYYANSNIDSSCHLSIWFLIRSENQHDVDHETTADVATNGNSPEKYVAFHDHSSAHLAYLVHKSGHKTPIIIIIIIHDHSLYGASITVNLWGW